MNILKLSLNLIWKDQNGRNKLLQKYNFIIICINDRWILRIWKRHEKFEIFKLSINELKEYIDQLKKEVDRVNLEVQKKIKLQSKADKIFK